MTTGAPGGIIIPEVPATAPGRRCWRAAGSGVGARLGILWPASCGHPRCRARATYVHGLGHCEPPDGRRRSNSAPGCAVRLRAVRSSLADHIREKKKSFCCVTTRRRNLWTFNGLGCSLGPLTALAFYLGMPDFGLGILAVFGLSPRRLPAANLSPAFRLLAISLVPAPRLVLVATPFAHAAPWTRSTSSGRALRLSLIVESAHGRLDLPRETLEENVTAFSSGNSKTRTRRLTSKLTSSGRRRQRRKQI